MSHILAAAVRRSTAGDANLPRSEHGEMQRLRRINAQLLIELEEAREFAAQAQRLADRDALTGLYNRRRLLELLDEALGEAARRQRYVGLLFVDLNGFKGINDEHGHSAGDKILTEMAKRIEARVRTGDIVGRYGGDEFVVILPDLTDWGDVTQVADTIRERVALPFRLDGHEEHLSAAIGGSMYPHHGDNVEALLQRADEAMYRLKPHVQVPQWSLGDRLQQQPLRRRNDKSTLGNGSEF